MNSCLSAGVEAANQIRIREAVKADIPCMVELLRDLFSIEADFHPDATLQRRGLELLLLDKSACVVVAECDGAAVGMCTMQCLISTAEGGTVGLLEDLVVAQEYRGCGIGYLLLKEMKANAAERGMSRIQLLTDKNNAVALDFYFKKGWQSTDLVCIRHMT